MKTSFIDENLSYQSPRISIVEYSATKVLCGSQLDGTSSIDGLDYEDFGEI